MINQDSYTKIGSSVLSGKIHFDSVGAFNNSSHESFKTNVIIDGEICTITFHVLDNRMMKHEILIGADFLNLIELHAVKGEVSIRRIPEKLDVTDDTNLPEVLKIDTVESVDPLDLSSISDENARKQIEAVARSYEPKKTHEIGVKMTLVLTDDIPVYQRPRRLSQLERKK